MSKDALLNAMDVSREALEQLDAYVALLQKWSRAINLIGPQEHDEIWTRHILDSAQLLRHQEDIPDSWLDLGSGAGLPGLVVAILLGDKLQTMRFHLVDADGRKAAFLREAARQLQLPVTVHGERLEDVNEPPFQMISARAFAPLESLLRLAYRFCNESSTFLLHKGQSVETELKAAQQSWTMNHELLPSLSDPTGHLLRISGLRPKT